MKHPVLPIALGAVALVLILLGLFALNGSSGEPDDGCVPLTLWSSDEKVPLLQEISRRYKESDRKTDGKCVNVAVSVHPSQDAVDVLADAPGSDPSARPDMWSPSSRYWVDSLRSAIATRPGRVRSVPENLPTLATSPIVIAMPEPMARELGWPEGAIGWRDMIALAQDPKGWGSRGKPWGAFKIGKTNPVHSTTGLLATIATATALSGTSDALTSSALDDPAVAGGLRALESTAVHYGKHSAVFVRNMYAADQEGRALDYVSAVALEEKVVLDYNQGVLVGDPVARDKPRVKLAAVFPTDGTTVSDNPALVVDAEWVTDQRKRAAEDFLRYVQEQKPLFTEAGFRDGEGNPGARHSEGNGTPANPSFRLVRTPAFEVAAGVRELWQRNRKRANVLLVVDVSKSMEKVVDGVGRTRLELARDAALLVPGQLTEDDTLALWEFSSPLGTEPRPWRERVAAGPVGVVRDAFGREVAGLQPTGATELYESTRAAVESVRGRYDQGRINAVVLLSDGRNEPARPEGLTTLVNGLQTADKDRVVRVFSIAYGDEADRDALAKISTAARGGFYDSSDAARIESVMADVLSNF
ncbi:substrate-binding domain-containing protein [Saccharothrix australiensis]|uniref:Ca-activated chloride channel family protein n=1 Tax=Saccharothrix australiensis TaxID=2072 RepID=A0A495VTM7_9PSEU|nr:substrate-binding domain-containing protein [Saccharothrix australiensis]RKT52574.1 Ca-activated chloride channel family protein [Saccharothrix australiensis]